MTEEQEDYSDWYYLKLVSADEQDFNVSNDEDNTLMIGDCQGECSFGVLKIKLRLDMSTSSLVCTGGLARWKEMK